MPASFRRRASDRADRAELESLERALADLCEDLPGLVLAARAVDGLESREARMQLEAYAERRERALDCLAAADPGPVSLRAGRLRKHIEALECSQAFFRSRAEIRVPAVAQSDSTLPAI